MKKKKLASRLWSEPKAVESNTLIETITRFWVTLAVIAAIFYVSAVIISRTAGFRDLVRQRLEMISGMTLHVEKVHATWSLDLVLDQIQETVTKSNRLPGIEIKRAELYWRLIPLMRGKGWPFKHLQIEDATLRFTRSADGNWAPLPQLNDALAPWVEIPTTNTTETGNVIHLTDYLRTEKAKLEISNLRVVWQTEGDSAPPLAVVEGFNLTTSAIRPFTDDVMWFKMKLQRGERNGVEWANGVNIEWIRLPDQDVILRIEGEIKPLSQISSLLTK